ncbi:hypothetical protein ACH5RR_029061 [Cinchona calisaya]|uniref:Cytochrome P450 n=1 Tax=Cinchona calisaya TaxID=153742 RepID=A0ABD2YQJ9_9GENT
MELWIFVCLFFLFLLIIVKTVRQSKPVKLPPGPKPLPIIGNMHQLIGSLPHRGLADLAKNYGPLMHLYLEVAKEILNDHDTIFASRPNLLSPNMLFYNSIDIAFSPYGDYWRQLRKICTLELLITKRVLTFRSIREEEVLDVIKSISLREGSIVNLTTTISTMTYSVTAKAAFGKRSKYHDEFMSAMEDVVRLLAGFSIADMYPSVKILERITGLREKLERTHKRVDQVLENILNEHRVKRVESELGTGGEAKEGLVDVLLNIQESGEFGAPLTDNNIKAVIFQGRGERGQIQDKKETKRIEVISKETNENIQKEGSKGKGKVISSTQIGNNIEEEYLPGAKFNSLLELAPENSDNSFIEDIIMLDEGKEEAKAVEKKDKRKERAKNTRVMQHYKGIRIGEENDNGAKSKA